MPIEIRPLALCAAVVFLAACSGSDDDDVSSGDDATTDDDAAAIDDDERGVAGGRDPGGAGTSTPGGKPDRTRSDDDDAIDDDDDTDDDATTPAALTPELGEMTVVAPSDGLPPEVIDQKSNNNLDVVRHDGRVFFVFRTAPSHFASADTVLYVVSSEDQKIWAYETSFNMQTDLREPRFLSWNGRLFLYFSVLGENALDFEPQGMMRTEYRGPGDWSDPEPFYDPGFIVWRTKVVNDVPYMLAYDGGANIYDFQNREPLHVHWLTTGDGIEWHGVDPDKPVVIEGGCSETDFVILDDGTVIAVSRNEAGDENGFGSKICRGEAGAPAEWNCIYDPKKYDSPLMFKEGNTAYLVGRRNMTKTGNYDLGYDDLSAEDQHGKYEGNYSSNPKRCSLWKVDPETLAVTRVADLPSKGDTCFPGIIDEGAHAFTIYNYTSPVDGEDISWFEGQLGPTLIYRIPLLFK